MIRSPLAAVVGAALLFLPAAGQADTPSPQRAAEAFMLAAQTQDHKTALLLLDA